MAASRKKRTKSVTAELDQGWQAVIEKATKKRAAKVAWPDPKPGPKKKKKIVKKAK